MNKCLFGVEEPIGVDILQMESHKNVTIFSLLYCVDLVTGGVIITKFIYNGGNKRIKLLSSVIKFLLVSSILHPCIRQIVFINDNVISFPTLYL